MSRRFIASAIQHWQFPEGMIQKTAATIEDIHRFLASGSISSQIHDISTATALMDVLHRPVPTAKKKVRFQVGDEVVVAEAYVWIQVRDKDAEGGRRSEKRTCHVKEGEMLSEEDRRDLRLDYWLYKMFPAVGGTQSAAA